MKRKTLFPILVISLILVSCAPVSTPAPTNTPVPSTTVTSTSVQVTSTQQPTATVTQPSSTPSVHENASENCFLDIQFIPEKTEMNEVASIWGNPSSKSSFGGDYEYWDFDFVGTPYVWFKNEIIDSVIFFLKSCSLEKIISKLGPPEKIEITVMISDIDLSATYRQDFHFTKLGFAYFRYCDETQDSFTFQPNDIVGGKEFYSPDKVIEDSEGFNMASYVYNWHGFGINVEDKENKIKDFVTPTP